MTWEIVFLDEPIRTSDSVMKMIIVSTRTDEQVYKEAAKKRIKHDL